MNDIDYGELERTTDRRVNVGCGDYPMAYFVNIDADPTKPADLHVAVPPLPFEDASLDTVWGYHFLEHLTFEDARVFMAESYRALAPGGKLGLVVPDTREIMRRWFEGSIDAVEYPVGVWHSVADLDAVCSLFLYSTIQESPHQWAYDEQTLGRLFVEAGFGDLKRIDRYRDPRIAKGAWYQFGIEGVKNG